MNYLTLALFMACILSGLAVVGLWLVSWLFQAEPKSMAIDLDTDNTLTRIKATCRRHGYNIAIKSERDA